MALGGQRLNSASLDVMRAWSAMIRTASLGTHDKPWDKTHSSDIDESKQKSMRNTTYTYILLTPPDTIIIRQFLSNTSLCIKMSPFSLRTSNSPPSPRSLFCSPRSLFSFRNFHHKVSQGLEFHFWTLIHMTHISNDQAICELF